MVAHRYILAVTAPVVVLVIAWFLACGTKRDDAPVGPPRMPNEIRQAQPALMAATAAMRRVATRHQSGISSRTPGLRVEQPASFTGVERISGATATLALVPIRGAPARSIASAGGATAYRNAWPGVDVVRTHSGALLKETIFVRAGQRSGSFAWTVRGTGSLRRATDGGLRVFVGGKATALAVPAPTILDAGGVPIRGSTARYRLTPGSTNATTILNLDWSVPKRTPFPFNVDPTFTTAQGATAVLGATSFTSTAYHSGNDAWALGDAYGLASTGSKLIVSESNDFLGHQHLYYYNSMPTTNAQPFDGMLGNASSGSTGFNRPSGIWSDGTKLAVTDPTNHRVMLWNTMPPNTSTPANVVLGQPNFSSIAANNGGVSASGLQSPDHVFFDGTHLIVADRGNNRVLIWNSWPTSNAQAADLVLGQANMTSNDMNRGTPTSAQANTLMAPAGVWSDGTHLYVADQNNYRVLGWNTFPTSNGQAADVVLGQSSFTTRACNGLPGKQMICLPQGITSSGGSLYVTDFLNNRVLKWNSFPASNGQVADVEIGQLGTTGTSAQLMFHPADVTLVGSKLAVLDSGNHRVLIYDTAPTADGASADHVVGQTDFTHGGFKGDHGEVLPQAQGVAFDSSGRLYVGSGEALIIQRFPASLPTTGATADLELGAVAVGGRITGSQTNWTVPYGIDIASDNTFVVGGAWMARATWWNGLPTASPTLWDGVVGQADFTSTSFNRGGTAARNTVFSSYDAAWDGSSHMAVADANNNRVLIWNSRPTNGQAADVVLGQPDGASTAPNNGGVTSSSLNYPVGVTFWKGRIIVADTNNNRILIWNHIPTADGTPADVVIGQASMTTNTPASTPTTMFAPYSVAAADGALAVADNANARVLIYDTIPTSNGASADRVIGQPDMTSNAPANTQTGLTRPRFVALRAGRLAVSDNTTRVMVYDDVVAPVTSGISAVQAGERLTFTYNTDEDATTEVVYDSTSHPGGSGYASSTGADAAGRSHQLVATGLIPGTTYYYRVVATDSHGNVSQSNEHSVMASNTSTFDLTPSFGDDATISEADPTHNNGGSATLAVGGAGVGTRQRSLLRFDLSQLPAGAVIDSATLTLHAVDAGAATGFGIGAQQVTSAWTEGVGDDAPQPDGTTWNSLDGVDPWSTAGGDVLAPVVGSASAPTTTPQTTDVDVTSAVTSWITNGTVNEGLLLAAASEPATDLVRFASGNTADPTLRPRLTVRWRGSDVSNPAISSVRVRTLASNSLEISWDTDEAATSAVDYGTSVAYADGTMSDPVSANHHVVVLSGLALSTNYHLRVRSTDAQGNQGISGDTVARTSYRASIEPIDTFIRADMPTRNNGGQSSLYVGNVAGSWLRTKSLLKFDLSSVPPGATIRSAELQLTSSGQANTTTPNIAAYPLTTPFVQGTGNARVGPPQVLTAAVVNGQTPLISPADRHVALTPGGWYAFTPYFDPFSLYTRYRQSLDGMSFGSDASFLYGTGRTGVTIDPDGSNLWLASFTDNTSTLGVRNIDSVTTQTQSSGTVAFATGVTGSPTVRIASDGYVWAKAESQAGAVWVTRSTTPRDATSWGTPTQLESQATPGHALLVALAGGNMALLSQDGSTIGLRTWNGSTWAAETMVTASAAPVSNWVQTENMAAVDDGTGGIWLTYLTGTGDVVAMHYAAGAWGSPETIQVGGAAAVAMTLDTGANEPHVAWLSGTNVMTSYRTAGAWVAPQTLQAGIVAGLAQLTMSAPSDESVGVEWAEPNGSNSYVRWRGYALPKIADGATWNTSDGTTAWTTPGSDEDPAAIAVVAAPNGVGTKLTMDFTSQVNAWLGGATNNGFVLRKETDNVALNDWKAFYSAEASSASLRPHLVVDYDLAAVTLSQPNASTAWRNGQVAEITWQTSGSGMTNANLLVSGDGGGTWSPIASNIANTGSYFWQVPSITGLYMVKIEALALGVPIATDTSQSFVVEDIPPSPVTGPGINSPSSAATLTWSMPADTGGAGMANGTYRIYRSSANGVQGGRIATVAALTYTDNSSLADGSWYYTVVPVDAAGNVQAVGNVQVVTAHDGSTPNPVADLAAPGQTNAPVALTWNAVSDNGPAGTSGYRVYRSSTSGVRGTLVRTVGTTSDADTPPSDGTWYYTIAPVDAAGNVRLTGNNQVGSVYDTTAPSPVSVVLDGGANWAISRNVTATLGASDAVEVQLSEDPAFAGASWVSVAATLPFTLSNVDGGHIVYARYRDAVGNVSTTASDSIGLDRVAPSGVTPMRDGGAASDRNYQSSTTQLQAVWTASTDPSGSGLARYDVCYSTATNCGGTVLSTWTSTGTATSNTLSGQSLTPGQTYYACVRSVDVAGNVLASADCTDGITVTSVTAASPNSFPQGRRSLVVQLTGAGFDPSVTASFSGTDLSVTNVVWLNSTRVDVTVDVATNGTPGASDVTLTSPDGASVTASSAVTTTASSITVSLETLSYDGTSTAPSTTGPFGIGLKPTLPGTTSYLGDASSGQTTSGAAFTAHVSSDADYQISTSATDFSGPAALDASALAWKHYLVVEPWTPFTTATGMLEPPQAPNAPGTTDFAYELRWTIPLAQAAGAYTTTVSIVVSAAI